MGMDRREFIKSCSLVAVMGLLGGGDGTAIWLP